MGKEKTRDKIFKFLVEKELKNYTDYDSEFVTSDTEIRELGLDSLDVLEAIMGAEEEFNIEIPDNQFQNARTVGDIVTAIHNCLKDQNGK